MPDAIGRDALVMSDATWHNFKSEFIWFVILIGAATGVIYYFFGFEISLLTAVVLGFGFNTAVTSSSAVGTNIHLHQLEVILKQIEKERYITATHSEK